MSENGLLHRGPTLAAVVVAVAVTAAVATAEAAGVRCELWTGRLLGRSCPTATTNPTAEPPRGPTTRWSWARILPSPRTRTTSRPSQTCCSSPCGGAGCSSSSSSSSSNSSSGGWTPEGWLAHETRRPEVEQYFWDALRRRGIEALKMAAPGSSQGSSSSSIHHYHYYYPTELPRVAECSSPEIGISAFALGQKGGASGRCHGRCLSSSELPGHSRRRVVAAFCFSSAESERANCERKFELQNPKIRAELEIPRPKKRPPLLLEPGFWILVGLRAGFSTARRSPRTPY